VNPYRPFVTFYCIKIEPGSPFREIRRAPALFFVHVPYGFVCLFVNRPRPYGDQYQLVRRQTERGKSTYVRNRTL